MPPPHKKSFAAEQLARQKKKSPIVLIVGSIAIIVLIIGGYFFYRSTRPQIPVDTPVQEIKSIAVLPFVDMSPEKDQEHLGNGIADAIINALTNMGDKLRVIDRTSSFEFRGKENAIDEIGEKLDVDTVLMGSVHKSGTRLRIIAQLINVSDHSHLFSKTYNIDFDELFAIQDTLSLAVLKEMKFTLMGKEQAAIVKRYTNDPDAWDIYLQARETSNRNRKLDLYNKALEMDPSFALVYAGIARGYNIRGYSNWRPDHMLPREAYPLAQKAVDQALDIDVNLCEAYTQWAWINIYYDWDWEAAENHLKKALEINPGYASAHHYYRDLYMILGMWDEAIEAQKQALSLDPLSLLHTWMLGYTYALAGNYDEALLYAQKSIGIAPDSWIGWWVMYKVYKYQSDTGKMLELLPKIQELVKSYSPLLADWLHTTELWHHGKKADVEQALQKLEGHYSEHTIS